MSDETDVLHAIDQLRRGLSGYHGQLKAHNDLKRHCDNQRERIVELEGLYAKAKADRDEAAMDFSKEHDRAEFLMRENAKLRELVSILSVINKNMSQCSVTDCNQCPVSNECSESVHLEGLLGIDTREISWRVQWRNEDSFDIQREVDKR